MTTGLVNYSHYLMPGSIFAHAEEHTVLTVLGSCISVCLWDPRAGIGGINHFMLPHWNGEGLPSPRFGNIAIPKLIEKMTAFGADRNRLQAKVFGGGDMLKSTSALMNIGQRNIVLAQDMLREANISVVNSDTGGNHGRKLLFNTKSGVVLLKHLKNQVDDINI